MTAESWPSDLAGGGHLFLDVIYHYSNTFYARVCVGKSVASATVSGLHALALWRLIGEHFT